MNGCKDAPDSVKHDANEPMEMDRWKPCLAYSSVLSAIKKMLIGDKERVIINMCHSEF